jgi:hypothetical protein
VIALYLCGFFAGGLLAAVVVHGVRGLIARPHRPYEPLADVDLRLRRIGDDYVAGRIDAGELEERVAVELGAGRAAKWGARRVGAISFEDVFGGSGKTAADAIATAQAELDEANREIDLEQRAQEVLNRLADAERRADELAEKLAARGRPEAA